MDSTYRPQSPDLCAVGIAPASPGLGSLSPPAYGNLAQHQFNHAAHHAALGGAAQAQYGSQPTSVPIAPGIPHTDAFHQHRPQQPPIPMAPRRVKDESDDDDFMPGAPASTRRTRSIKQEPPANGKAAYESAMPVKPADPSDPTLGCQIKTSFPVARIKRIMQADEDIGKVAQVTPTVVSRALELFMIKLISAAALQARGPVGDAAAAPKGPRRVLAQHLKKAVLADPKLDFLEDHVGKVPDAPVKTAKKDAGSDSEDAKPAKKGKKRKGSSADF